MRCLCPYNIYERNIDNNMSTWYEERVIDYSRTKENFLIEYTNPFFILKPRLFKDGNQWCALYGDNIQEHLSGFGDTPSAAASSFNENWNKK